MHEVIKEQQEGGGDQDQEPFDPMTMVDVKTGDIPDDENNGNNNQDKPFVKQEAGGEQQQQQQDNLIPAANVKQELTEDGSSAVAPPKKTSSSKIFKCMECNKAFKRQRKLLKHVTRRHGAKVDIPPKLPPPPSAPASKARRGPRKRRFATEETRESIAERIARATANGEVDVAELSAKEVSYDPDTERWQCQVISDWLL